MLALSPERIVKGTKRRAKKGLGHKLRRAGRASESCEDKSWLAAVAPPPRSEVSSYLESFGYAAADAQNWEDLPQDEVPEGLDRSGAWLGLGIAEHWEAGGHTWYQVECSLAMQGSKTIEWQVGRRLQHLRELWYDSVKSELGKSYKQHFDDCHFAHRGGRKGTSMRLNTWCCRLAARINSGQISPAVVALTLRFLEAPDVRQAQDSEGKLLRMPAGAARCGPLGPGEESVSSRSTRCSSTDGPAASSVYDTSDPSDCEEDDEEYESDFESDSESTEESEEDED
mmetsp:Transcript_34455/g.77886  ORF Transcript_34455/g.77886 Transcript_34455/m.77886 type:complete len:284 (-) Transcript_34455:6-857(-)